jgi:predicted TIM-barrel fold metal-dependent hydrolase
MPPEYRIVSADAHVLEPPHIWETWLPKEHRAKAPVLAKDVDGGDGWRFAGSAEPDPIGLVTTPGLPWDQFRWTGVTYEQARPGCYDGSARLADLDIDGVDAEILFPPQRTIGHFLGDEDDDFVRAGVDAYNRFLWEEFCAPDRDRLVGMAQIGSTGVDDAVDTLRKAKATGFHGVVISCWPSGGDSISDDDDPFWATAADEGMPVCIHINLIGRTARQRARAAVAAQGGTRPLYGDGDKASKANAKAVGGLSGVFSMVPGVIGQLIFTGVFERFPDLHVAMIETGVGWIPYFVEQMDDRYWRNRSWGNIPLSEPPSFYWYRNMSATFIVDRWGIANRHGVGVDNMMWSTDYPHHGNDWPYSRKAINDAMADVPADEKHRIVAGNAVRIFGLGQPRNGR